MQVNIKRGFDDKEAPDSVMSEKDEWSYGHENVNHSAGEYARDNDGDVFCEVHVNTMKGFLSLLRSWLRFHREISQEKLPVYLGFFEFVHNFGKRGKALLHYLIDLLVKEDPETLPDPLLIVLMLMAMCNYANAYIFVDQILSSDSTIKKLEGHGTGGDSRPKYIPIIGTVPAIPTRRLISSGSVMMRQLVRNQKQIYYY